MLHCSLPLDARGVVIDPEVYNVHDVTGTLKQFFHSLPDPLLTLQLYNSFIATMRKLRERERERKKEREREIKGGVEEENRGEMQLTIQLC